MPYETFDIDLRDGIAREDAFVHVMLRARVEHKRDRKAARTGRIALEIEQRMPDGRIEPSGIMVTTAERWAIEYAPECWLILPVEFVRVLARDGLNAGMDDWIGDGKNHHNILLPIELFVSASVLARVLPSQKNGNEGR